MSETDAIERVRVKEEGVLELIARMSRRRVELYRFYLLARRLA